ncbi:PilZ domain-containing protein [Shewanella sp. 10N.261.52.F9]|uniref:flagellar brake protein n=1 Tax=Shewanella TaxID=22 RepID=UPI0020103D86|nr:PilZ domain-containing protein [Shewanella marinintestina]MCL1148259.1 flagellar brake protein [Shewanella marinintestina]
MQSEKDFNTLDTLNCNTDVHLQLLTPTQTIRLRSRLIGVDPGRSVILTLGNDKSWQTANPYIRERQSVVIRVVNSDEQDANILAFRSTIQKVVSETGQWLIITYPKELQTVSLRQHSRVPINIKASLISADASDVVLSGHLKDISIKGGAFAGDARTDFVIDSQFRLKIELDDEVKTIAVILKNQQLEAQTGLAQYGFIIDASAEETEDLVQKVVLQHLNS